MNADTQLTVGIHILCLLASQPGERITSEWIAGSVNTNPVVVRRTLGKLRRAGLVRSANGKGGGWELLRPPESISLRELFALLRTAPVLAMHRDAPNPQCPIGAGIQRALPGYYRQAEEALASSLGTVTIADVLGSVLRAQAAG
ncbi:MAG TPA: Rrf2 family transcriptional regulator [Bryobacteraceae bacterium]|nr:Rrf2 family transcriptional regulator [Bryobacteraceae bacterium]